MKLLIKKRYGSARDFVVTTIDGLAYGGILLVWTLGFSLIFRQYLVPVQIVVPAEEVAPSALAADPSVMGTILLSVVAATIALVSLLIFLTLPFIIGSFCSRAIKYLLNLLGFGVSWRSLYFTKGILLIMAFAFLSVVVLSINLAAGYPLLVFGGIITAATLLLIVLHTFLEPQPNRE